MSYYTDQLHKAKQQVSLVDYISTFYDLNRVGNKEGLPYYQVSPCPICSHKDHFTVYAYSQSYYSFSDCCKGGSIIDFLQEVEGMSKEQAYRKTFRLADMEEPQLQTGGAAVATTKAEPKPKPKDRKKAAAQGKAAAIRTNKNDYTRIINQLHQNSSRTDYFKKRGLSQNTIDRYKLGYHEQGLNYVIRQNVGLQEKQNGYMASYRYFLPVWDSNHSCNYFIARIDDTAITGGNKKPHKTHNLKGHTLRLFNDRYLHDFSLTDNIIFIVEGIFDALSLEELGYHAIALNSVQNAGKLLNQLDKNKQQLKNKTFVIAADNDTAGAKLLEYQSDIKYMGFDVTCYQLPQDRRIKDINDFLVLDRAACQNHIHNFVDGIVNKDRVSNYLKSYIHELMENKNKKAIPTGFDILDRKLGGGLYSGFYVMGAISSLGKTTFAVQIADHIAAQGQDVLFFSLEMSKLELVSKSLSREQFRATPEKAAGTREVMNGDFDNDTMKAAASAYMPTSQNLFIVEGGFDTNIMQLKQRIKEHIRLKGTKPIVFVDYLQILRPMDERMNDKQATDQNVTQLKIISRQLDVPIIAVSSFNRMNYSTSVTFESFKESGSIEYTADVMIGLQLEGIHELSELKKEHEKREKLNKLKSETPRRIELVILKNRNGKAFATVGYDFYPKFNFFAKERESNG